MGIFIHSIRDYLPEKVVTNEDLSREFPEWSVEKIADKTGISVRHIAAESETAADLGIFAAQRLFQDRCCDPSEIDILVFCTQAPDYILPTTACVIQNRLNLRTDIPAFDINLGCSGFVYGLSVITAMMTQNGFKKGLLITGDTYTKLIHPLDKSVRTLFGDGAAATLLVNDTNRRDSIGQFLMGSDGSGAAHLMVKAGGFRHPEAATELDSFLYMDGKEIFNFTLNIVPKLVEDVLKKNGLQIEDIDYFVFHQANQFMLSTLRKKIKIPEEKFCVAMRHFGNTVSSTIPMALAQSIRDNKIKPNDRVLLVGFGVGTSWSAVPIIVQEELLNE